MIVLLVEKNVKFAVSGAACYPDIKNVKEGFFGRYADILACRWRPTIGYRSLDNKIILTMRPICTLSRARRTFINLKCDFGISLDGGGSSILKVLGIYYRNTTRFLHAVISWK